MATKKQAKNVEVKATPKMAPKATAKAQPKAAPANSEIKKDELKAVIPATESTTTNIDAILELRNITKTFLGGKIVANDDVSLSFARNEVHAIVGENGSGKSTLMNIIFGLYKQDQGDIFLNGKKVDMYQSGAAKKHRIGMVHQHFHLVDEFTVLENVILGQEELTKSKKEKTKIKGLKKELKDVKAQLRALWKSPSMKIEPDTENTVELSFEDQNLTLENKRTDLEEELAIEEKILADLIVNLKEEKANHTLFKKTHKPIVDHLDELMVILDGIHELESNVLVQRDLVLSIKEKINRVNHEMNILAKTNKMSKKRVSQKLQETDTNFVAGVIKLVKLRHQVEIDIEKEENIISELKNERARLSKDNKHHAKRLEQIKDEIIERSDIIKEERLAIELIEDYQSAAKNEEQTRAAELGKRQYEIEIELDLLEHKLIGSFGKIKFKDSMARLKEIQLKYNIHLDPYAKVSTLAVGQRQMVEILKVLWEEKDIIVFDEPTATLSVVEIEALLETIDSLKKEGKTIIFISHKLKEVKALADRVSVLRKGVMMGTYDNDDKLQPADIGELMVGRTIEIDYPARNIEEKPIVKVENLSYRTSTGFKAVDNVSFDIYEGEIFGLAGIEGNGQEEIVKMFTDLRKPYKGTISMKRDVKKKEAKQLLKERAKLESERILERAAIETERVNVKFFEKEIRENTKIYMREAEMDAISKKAKVLAELSPKAAKLAIKEIKHELKKDQMLIKKNEHVEIKELHSHKRAKEMIAQRKQIKKVSEAEAKAIITETNKLIKSKTFEPIVWDVLTDSNDGYQFSGKERREFQSHVPIDRLKHGVVPTKDLEFNVRITDFDSNSLNKLSKEQKALAKEEIDNKYAKILETSKSDLEVIENEITKLNSMIENSEFENANEKQIRTLISQLNSSKQKIENDIKHNDSRKSHEMHLMMNPVYNFTEKVINGMNVDGAFNHQVELRNLSGGNQQKFVVGREMFRDHKLFVAGHPTRGLDISAIDHIYTKMRENSEGKATLLYSLEINELLAVCDRVAVMYHGKIIDIIDPKKVTLEEVSRMMIGEGGKKTTKKTTTKPKVEVEVKEEAKQKAPQKAAPLKQAAPTKQAAPVKKAPAPKPKGGSK